MPSTLALDLNGIARAVLPDGLRRWLVQILERIGEVAAAAAAVLALFVGIFG